MDLFEIMSIHAQWFSLVYVQHLPADGSNTKCFSHSPGIIWIDLDKIATKGFPSELSSTMSHKPQKKNPPKSTLRNFRNRERGGFFFGNCRHLEEMHCHKKPFVAILSHSGPRFGPDYQGIIKIIKTSWIMCH